MSIGQFALPKFVLAARRVRHQMPISMGRAFWPHSVESVPSTATIMRQFCSISSPPIALAILSLYATGQAAMSSYQMSVITTLEKRFQIGTTRIGWLIGASDLGGIVAILFASYFGSKGNAPRVLAVSAVGVALSAVIYVFPYFLYGPKLSTRELKGIALVDASLRNSSEKSGAAFRTCSGLPPNASAAEQAKEASKEGVISDTESVVGFAFMVIGRVFLGMFSSPLFSVGISFIDDMVGSRRSGIYIGILYATITLAPTFGFLSGSFAVTVHESLRLIVTDHPGGQKDPRWIGAWWIGFLFFGLLSLFISPLMWSLTVARHHNSEEHMQDMNESTIVPLRIVNAVETRTEIETGTANETNEDREQFDLDVKEMFFIIGRLLKAPVFVCMTIGSVFHFLAFTAYFGYVAKILEYSFAMIPSQANIVSGVILSTSSVIAATTSGLIDRWWPMTVRGMCRYNACMVFFITLLFPMFFALSCSAPEIKGMGAKGPRLSCINDTTCRCSAFYRPICVDDVIYFSACHAGCTNLSGNGTDYLGCLCGNFTRATPGACMQTCTQVYPFECLLFVILLLNGLSAVQYTKVCMSQTTASTKPVALGTMTFVFQVVGMFVPSSLGRVIDTACRLTQSGADNCLVYDGPRMTRAINVIALVAIIPAFCFQTAAWYFSPREDAVKELDRNCSGGATEPAEHIDMNSRD